MTPFLSNDFLLTSETSKKLYHEFAADLPIVDYHCHVSPQEIFEDKHFKNIAEVWLGGDHYKWRLMRSNGIDEEYITGNAPDREKFQKFAETLPKAIGNPMYHWCHLELKKYFGYTGILNGDTAQEVWDLSCDILSREKMGVRGIIEMSNVDLIGTTDDPVDSLEWHEKLASDKSFHTLVVPSFRPDKALNIEKADWLNYIELLGKAADVKINGLESLKNALRIRMDFFAAHGCRASDHGLDYMVYADASEQEVEEIVKRGLAGERATEHEAAILKTHLLKFCAGEYVRLGWVMQLHYNCLRNPNSAMFSKIGPDRGFDSMGPRNSSDTLPKLLDALYSADALPRMILYSLDGCDNAFLDSLIGALQGPECAGKLQHGSAWWFNDTKQGMRDQLTSLANLGILGNFVGMLTDSRSFLSYTRHEYFRRILCELIGTWVEEGEYPADWKTLKELVGDISYYNAKRYFKL